MTYAINARLEITERAFWHSTVKPPTVIATVTAVKPQRVGVRYIVTFELPKLLNGKPVQCHRVLTDAELKQCFVREVPPAKRTRKAAKPRTVARSGKRAA